VNPGQQNRPLQAVILAGGKGIRLMPLTSSLPKPMVRFHGKPFLEYLILQLRDQGFERVLLLLGYLPDPIRAYFGDGRKFGLSIQYSISPVDDETGTRLRKARAHLDPVFLLLYCDNYWPMDLARMWGRFQKNPAAVQTTVYTNRDHYSRSNVRVAPSSLVEVYDKSRNLPGLQGVDIGYTIVTRGAIDSIPPGNQNFEGSVYPALAARGKLAAHETDHRYYSIGDHRRLSLTREFLARRPAIILDRDGVLNVKPPRACYVTTPEGFVWIPGAIEAVRLLKRAGYRILLVTNQAGIARGKLTGADLDAIHLRMQEDLAGEDAGEKPIDAIYVCPHGWDEGCRCRKPSPGMLFAAQRDFHLDLSRVPFVGDDERDFQAGRAAGCPTYLVSSDQPLIHIVEELLQQDQGESSPGPLLAEAAVAAELGVEQGG